MGWAKTIQYGNATMPERADKWPWTWTYTLFLEKRWEQVQEIGSMYGDDEMPEGNYFKEVPKEFWHDQRRVDKWIKDAKERKKKQQDEQSRQR